MIFDVLKSTVSFTKYGDSSGSMGIRFDVAPNDRAYLEIGDKYILCGSGYLPFRDKGRDPATAAVHVVTDRAHVEKVAGGEPICGRADFFAPKHGDGKPLLSIIVAVEPQLFEEMLRTSIAEPGAATLSVSIEGLKHGWEPDGSHEIWDLEDPAGCGSGERRRVTDFWFSVETFWTNEEAVREMGDTKFHARLVDSPDPDDRRLLTSLQPTAAADPIAHLLRQCRTLLVAMLVLGVIGLWKFAF